MKKGSMRMKKRSVKGRGGGIAHLGKDASVDNLWHLDWKKYCKRYGLKYNGTESDAKEEKSNMYAKMSQKAKELKNASTAGIIPEIRQSEEDLADFLIYTFYAKCFNENKEEEKRLKNNFLIEEERLKGFQPYEDEEGATHF